MTGFPVADVRVFVASTLTRHVTEPAVSVGATVANWFTTTGTRTVCVACLFAGAAACCVADGAVGGAGQPRGCRIGVQGVPGRMLGAAVEERRRVRPGGGRADVGNLGVPHRRQRAAPGRRLPAWNAQWNDDLGSGPINCLRRLRRSDSLVIPWRVLP